MRKYGGNKINSSYSVENNNNNNNNNCSKYNNIITKKNWRRVWREHLQWQYFWRSKK